MTDTAIAMVVPELNALCEPFCRLQFGAFERIHRLLHPEDASLLRMEEALVSETERYLHRHADQLFEGNRARGDKTIALNEWPRMFSATGDIVEATETFRLKFNLELRSRELHVWLKEVTLDERGALVQAVFVR